jgi:hypothetical protein
VITPRRDLDDEHTRLVTYDQAHAASVEHCDAVGSVAAGLSAAIAGARVSSENHLAYADRLDDGVADEAAYRAALAALSGVVQRSLRDFLA